MVNQLPLLLAEPDAAEVRIVRCRSCRRPLRSPEARAHGQGDGCREEEYAARRFDVEQDRLPGL